jgi:hypothetical protein
MPSWIQAVIDFFKKMLSDDSSVSSKRVVGFGSFLLLVAIHAVHLATKQAIQVDLIYADVAIIGACFGMNTLISLKGLGVKGSVASSIAEANSDKDTNQTAKEVVQGDNS